MLFDSSIRKELSRSFGATLVVLVTVVMTMMLIRTLGQASKGNVSPSDVMLVMGFTVLGQLSTILTLSLFVAIVGTLSRMYRDSEMAIWFASGQGLASLLRPLLRFSWPIMAMIAVLSLLLWPWSNQQIQQLRQQFEQRSDIDRIAPGEFQESANGARVFFIDKDSPGDARARNIFIVDNTRGKEAVTSAKSAELTVAHGVRTVTLRDGHRVETKEGDDGLKISRFQQYSAVLSEAAPGAMAEGTLKARFSHLLWADGTPAARAELGWRLGLPIAAFNFVVLALTVSVVNPRASQSIGLIAALLAFVIYYNLMTVGQSWIAAGRISMPAYLLVLHGGILALGLGGLAMRHWRWSFKDLWRARSTGAAA